MDPKVAVLALKQVRDGRDFPSPRQILNRIPAQRACEKCEPFACSLATYVLHTDFWQVLWLNKLRGLPGPKMFDDWREPSASEWHEVRTGFLQRLDDAISFAEAQPFDHQLKTDEDAVATLLQIAVHDAYHVGQFVLLKRAIRHA